MRKPKTSGLLIITIVFAAFTFGFFWGRNQQQEGISVTVSEKCMTVPAVQTEISKEPTEEAKGVSFPIDINRAEKEEFMALPGIGDVLAERIIVYRQEHGDFSCVEDLLNVEGVGKKRLEEILDFITIGG